MSSDTTVRASRRYVAVLLAATLLPVVAVAGFNWWVDPLAQFGDPDSPRPACKAHYRLIKAHGIADADAGCFILGSSRLAIGLDPDSPQLAAGGGAYNAALTDGRIYEIARFAEHAIALHDRPRLIIGLDFYTFHLTDTANPDWREDRLAVDAYGHRQWIHRWADVGGLLCSRDITERSWETWDLLDRAVDPAERAFRRNGFAPAPLEYVRDHGGYRGAFRHKELGEMLGRGRGFYRALQYPRTVERSWTAFDRLLDTLVDAGVEVDLVLPPVHARYLELLDLIAGNANEALLKSGRAPTWGVDHWKVRLVRHLEALRRRRPEARIRLWDFMTHNDYTTAGLVTAADAEMPYHWEPSHFKPVVGEAILARLLGGGDPAFGAPLDGAGLPAHLAAARTARDAWRRENPADVRELTADWKLVLADHGAALQAWEKR